MHDLRPAKVAIIDYGLGNLYSVKRACEHVGIQASITSAKHDLLHADAVILPGVGAFGNAMETLYKLDLVSVLQDIAAAGTPLMGICLGMQLLMTESYEFGRHKGLGVIAGSVMHLEPAIEGSRRHKVPHVGWNRLVAAKPWTNTLLDNVVSGEYMYFVHSYVVQPEDPNVMLAMTRYGPWEFCSSLASRNVFACQFHPERSGWAGLQMYHNLHACIKNVV